MTTCKECGRTLGGATQVAGFYSMGKWSTTRQGNYCYDHQESPSDRRWNVAIGLAVWFTRPFLYLLPFALLFLVLRFA